jgi:hypothetical protein
MVMIFKLWAICIATLMAFPLSALKENNAATGVVIPVYLNSVTYPYLSIYTWFFMLVTVPISVISTGPFVTSN